MKISLCIATFNRTNLLYDSFNSVIDDPRIDEVVIVDDHSTHQGIPVWLRFISKYAKVTLVQNVCNIGASANKARAITFARNEHCIIFDSDNVMRPDYLDALEPHTSLLTDNVILCPCKARPNFDFTPYQGHVFGLDYIKQHMGERMFDICLNVCNWAIARRPFLMAYQPHPELKGADGIWFLKGWLEAGYRFMIVPGMEYDHLVHAGSNWLANEEYNNGKFHEALTAIRNL